jgi:hypothetical protein
VGATVSSCGVSNVAPHGMSMHMSEDISGGFDEEFLDEIGDERAAAAVAPGARIAGQVRACFATSEGKIRNGHAAQQPHVCVGGPRSQASSVVGAGCALRGAGLYRRRGIWPGLPRSELRQLGAGGGKGGPSPDPAGET